MSRLPNPGGDDGQWGALLNDFLLASHAADGTIKASVVDTAQIADAAVTTAKLGTTATPTSGQVLSYNGTALSWSTPSGSGSVPDADATTKGLIRLTGDLGGTAATPTVPGLAAKAADSAVVHNTGAETVAGVKTFSASPIVPTPTTGTQAATKAYVDAAAASAGGVTSVNTRTGAITLTSTDVGLANVNNTSDANKPISTATATALSGKVDTSDSRLTDQRVPTANSVSYAKLSATGATTGQVLSYDGTNLTWSTPAAGAGDATTSTNGVVRLAGDLAGTAAAPSVAKIKGITLPASAPTTGQVLTATSASATAWSTPSGGGGNGSRTVTAIKTGAYTAAAGEYVLVDASSAGFTITLPAVANGAWVSVKKLDSSVNTVLVQAASGQIDGQNSSSVQGQYTAHDYISDGTTWYQVG